MGGRLSRFSSEWITLSDKDWLQQTIRSGFQIPFHTAPPLTFSPTPVVAFSQEQVQQLDSAIHDLLQKAAIEIVQPSATCSTNYTTSTLGFYSSMFVIPKKNGGIRPVFNLKRLNQYVSAPHFKMETLKEVSLMLRPNDYMTSIDLSDAFLHIPVHVDSRPYLRFQWKSTIYQWRTTPFGLSVVPWLFTKITRPILEWARRQGVRISNYLDDWIISAPSRQLAKQHTTLVLNKLQRLGWKVNLEKSILTPTQELEHLGFALDTTRMIAKLPGKKLRDIQKSIRQILQSPRSVHSLTMRLKAATFAIFPARLYTQHLLRFKNSHVKQETDWDIPQSLDQPCVMELKWWLNNLKTWNGRSWIPTTPAETLYVDASDTGWGCSWKQHRAHGFWTEEESNRSINWRELKAAQLALLTFPKLRNTTVLIRTDNTTSLSYINKQGGTRSLELMNLATTLWKWCLQNNLSIQAQHIPGVHNVVADQESRRTFTKNTWQVLPSVFDAIQRQWGPCSVDLFADRTSHLLPRYVSWTPDPGAIHTDAFTMTWSNLSNPWINPPWNLITRVLNKILREQLPVATMVVPFWPSALWFPMIQAMAISPPLFLSHQHIRTTIPSTPWPLQENWMLSVWKLSATNTTTLA